MNTFIKHIRKFERIVTLFRNKPIIAYIHIPKTGGTYLSQIESTKRPILRPIVYLGHTTIISDEYDNKKVYPPTVGFLPNYVTYYKSISNYYVMSTVRNIFSWLVSYYHHCGGFNPRYKDTNHYDYYNAQKGFDYLVKTIANRDKNTWPNNQMIFFQIFADNGDLVVDWINRTENLDENLERLANELQIKYLKQDRQRVSGQYDYRDYYNNELIDLVVKTWARELRLFGYNFDGFYIENAYLKIKISSDQKTKVKYFWDHDKLIVNNEIWHREG